MYKNYYLNHSIYKSFYKNWVKLFEFHKKTDLFHIPTVEMSCKLRINIISYKRPSTEWVKHMCYIKYS